MYRYDTFLAVRCFARDPPNHAVSFKVSAYKTTFVRLRRREKRNRSRATHPCRRDVIILPAYVKRTERCSCKKTDLEHRADINPGGNTTRGKARTISPASGAAISDFGVCLGSLYN